MLVLQWTIQNMLKSLPLNNADIWLLKDNTLVQYEESVECGAPCTVNCECNIVRPVTGVIAPY